MRQLEKPVKFIVGVIVIILAFKFFVGSGYAYPLFAPAVESGKLGATGLEFWASVAEVLFSVVSSIGGIAIFIVLKGHKFIVSMLSPLFGELTAETSASGADTTSPNASAVGKHQSLPPAMYADLSKLLLQSVMDADKKMTIVLAEKMAGIAYLSKGETRPEPVFQSSFPVVEAAE